MRSCRLRVLRPLWRACCRLPALRPKSRYRKGQHQLLARSRQFKAVMFQVSPEPSLAPSPGLFRSTPTHSMSAPSTAASGRQRTAERIGRRSLTIRPRSRSPALPLTQPTRHVGHWSRESGNGRPGLYRASEADCRPGCSTARPAVPAGNR